MAIQKIITWPESQKLAELKGYGNPDNCRLVNGQVGMDCYGQCAYLVDVDWYATAQKAAVPETAGCDESSCVYDIELMDLGFIDPSDVDDYLRAEAL